MLTQINWTEAGEKKPKKKKQILLEMRNFAGLRILRFKKINLGF